MFLFGPDIRQRLRQEVFRSAEARQLAEAIIERSQVLLDQGPIFQQFEPDRQVLLPTTRSFAHRAQHLIVAWLLTGDTLFVRGIIDDLMVATNMPDWNTRHFLDVAEMSSSVALAWRWTIPFLTEEQKQKAGEALLEQGLKRAIASYNGPSGWTVQAGNWNIVCNSAMIVAALAASESYPLVSARILARAQNSLKAGMQAVGPSGEWFEGLTYWSYAAHHAALAQAAIEQEKFALQDPYLFVPILKGGDFAAASIGPSGLAANFGDSMSAPEQCGMQAWISARDRRQLPAALAGHLAFDLVWMADNPPSRVPQKSFVGAHLAVLRTGDDWLAVSIGTAVHAHAHHDLGSFLWETGGQRFVVDPGRLHYALPGYFGADRFTHAGASAAAHNLLLFPAQSQAGWRAEVENCSEGDGTQVLSIQCGGPDGLALERKFELVEAGLRIEDRVAAGRPSRWQFHTDAEVSFDGEILLLHKPGLTVRASTVSFKAAWDLQVLDSAALGLPDCGTVTRASFGLDSALIDKVLIVHFDVDNRRDSLTN